MTNSFDSFIDSLIEDDTPLPVKATTTEQKFPCGQCGGTGVYKGARVHQEKSHCFACRGLGYFKTDPRKLMAKRLTNAAAKKSALDVWRRQNNELLTAIGAMASWSPFAGSLVTQAMSKPWSEAQMKAARNMVAKMEAKRLEKEAAVAAAPVVDLSTITKMFETAKVNGYKKPVYRAEGLVLSLAWSGGRNAGALYVKSAETDTYFGKVLNNKFQAMKGHEGVLEALQTIAADPLAAAVRYGQRTGTCSCCGRKLTNGISIDLGIGPICRKSWGL